MKKATLLVKLWLPVVCWCSLLFYFSSVPNLKASQNPAADEIVRTLAHLFLFALGYGLFFRAFNLGRRRKQFLKPLVFVWLYALFDETHQIFVPTRTFQLMDLAIDCGGAFLAKVAVEEFGK